jgi:hypothetical protein
VARLLLQDAIEASRHAPAAGEMSHA